MDKKTYVGIIILVLVTFALTWTLKYYRPESHAEVEFDDFPLQMGDWTGVREKVSDDVISLLNPKDIFSAWYTNSDGIRVHLFFDYFSSDAGFGGPHSPRNCLPGSGWTIEKAGERTIEVAGKPIETGRFNLRYGESRQVMEFWYITSYGATGNDYLFKFYQMLSSLTFQPKDVGFIRFVTSDKNQNLEAMEQFQKLAIREIYRHMDFTYREAPDSSQTARIERETNRPENRYKHLQAGHSAQL